jgi:hypothetical protein
MDGGDPEVDRVAELSCWTIADALIEKSISTDKWNEKGALEETEA